MIKRFALTLLPFVRPSRVTVLKAAQMRMPLSINRNLFSTQKQDQAGKQSKQQHKSEGKNEAQKTENGKTERKLTDLSNQELIELNTEQSIKLVNLNIKKMEELRAKQEKESAELSQQMKNMDKHHNESLLKEEQLLENIKLQEEQLQRIKKRADKEIDDSKDFAITKLVKELLEFADSIKRCKILAEQKLKDSPNDEYLKKMIDLQNQLQQFLKLYDIEQFDPINQPFDPNTSQSLVTIPTPPGYQKNNVATTMMTGYRIKSRLLRSAKVGIFV